MRKRRQAILGYLRDGRGRWPLHDLFSGLTASHVEARPSGLLVTFDIGDLFAPWPALGPLLANATPEERQEMEVASAGGSIHSLYWPRLDEALGLDGLAWEATLVPPGRPKSEIHWVLGMPEPLARWVKKAYARVGRPMPAHPFVPFRAAEEVFHPATGEHLGTLSSGCLWCDLALPHTRHLDEG